MSGFSFAIILTSDNRIETPPQVKQITGHNPDTYLAADRAYMHFSDVYTTTESARVLDTIAAVVGNEARGGIWGDEFVASVPQPIFQKVFPTSQPS